GMVSDDWNGFNILHRAASRVGGLDIGFHPGAAGKDVSSMVDGSLKALYLLDADEIATEKLSDTFVIYQGHHGDKAAHVADVILPGSAYTEKSGTYVNTEGRVQVSRRAVFAPGEAKEDWAIIRKLSEILGQTLPYNDLSALRNALRKDFPHLAEVDSVPRASWGDFGVEGELSSDAFVSPIENFYMTCAISRSSETMAQCTQDIILNAKAAEGEATGTHG
ncbi:MAG: molybdopterin-dependent oxidoreductase, partial [Alphaproteobacteria bacterium]|nr:molybdopterin-dependent oxidoreductase [Alphaproteobacteria bacterium]